MPFATNNGARIWYETEGEGPPLVLHIGFLGSLEDWIDAGYVAALRDRFRLVAIDPRGQGQSDKPHEPTAYTDRHRVGDVLAVLDAEGIDRVHFWGYSMGGWVGYLLGAAAPDRLTSLVVGGAKPFAGNPRPLDGDLFVEGLRRGMTALVAEWEEQIPGLFASAGERDRWLAADAEALLAARIANFTGPDPTEEAIAGIRTPALLYAGTLDEPDPVAQAARLMPNARFVALDGLDHAQGINRSDLVLPHVEAFFARIERALPHTPRW